MPTYIDTTNLSPATIAQLQGPVITQIQITNSSYVVLDDTAVSNSGGYIKITGSNFTAGTQVVIGTVAATSVTFVNSTTLNVQVPAQSAGSYVVYVTVNTGSVAILVNGLTYSGVPTWVTGSTLPAGQVGTAISIQLSATGDAPLTYALAAGSSLPSGVTLTSGGLLSGTVTGITNETVYNFTINAIDNELQDSPRGFSITITANDQYFEYVTSLLSAGNPASTFVTDASTNGFAVTVNGDTRPSNFGPYTPGYYSNYFDGTGDYLRVANNAALELGSSDFTIEFWINWVSFQANKTILTKGYGTIYAPFLFYTDVGAAFNIYMSSTGSSFNIANGLSIIPSVVNGTWYHCVLTRSGSNFATYVNGVRSATFTSSSALFPAPTYDLTIAASIHNLGDNPNCYISNLRIVKGTAVYDPTQTTLTVPTTPLTAIANTSLLTCQSNRFIDNSTNNFTITRNGDTLISSFDPFVPNSSYAGYGSGYFDGTGDYLTLPASQTALQPGSGDFTIELWYYYAASPGGYINMFSYGASGNVLRLFLYTTNSLIVWTGVTPIITANNAHVPSAWNHVAIVRSGLTVTLYVNGTSVGTATGGSTTNYVGDLSIAFESGQTPFTGYMSNFRMVKGTAVYTTNFTPSTTPLTAIANTSLLTLQNNQPNNNSMFLDGSTNNFNITRNGNTTQGAFTPYAGTWSVNFSNAGVLNSQSTSGAYLSIPNNTGFDMGTGDFTMEGWIYPQSFPSSDNWPSAWFQTSSLFGRGTNNLGDGYNLILGATRLIFQNSDTNVTNGLHNMVVNNWYHVAACRSSGTLRLFVNGVQVASTSFTSSVGGGSNFFIGCETGQGAYFNGYMSNIRVLKGTALYTGAFTPPTQPLIPTSTTSLLTCADNRFVDDSNSGSVVTATNSPTVQRFSPFAPQLQQTPTSYSVAFDGTGDYLSCGTNSAYAMGTGDFTWEAWVYFASGSSYRQIFSTRPSAGSSTTAGSLSVSNTNGLNWYTNSAIINYTTSIGTDQWVHVAICRSSTTIRAFANGVIVGSATNSDNLTASTFSVGANNDGSEAFNGRISNVRVVKGTALYTANFTPSTTPLTAVSGTSLLTCQNTTIIDNSTNNFAITVNGNSQPVPQNPFGYSNPASTGYTPATYGGSALFGSGNYLSAASNAAFGFGTGDFTVEAWVFPNAAYTTYNYIWAAGAAGGLVLYILGGVLYVRTYNGSDLLASSTAPAINAWTHVAATRSGTTLRIFVNGVQTASATNSTNFAIGPAIIGNDGTNVAPWLGYISDLRVVKGTALYTSAFVPPVAPLTAQQNTVLLNNMTGAGIYDSSMMANYETVGNSSISTSLKKYGNTSMYFDGSGDYLVAAATNLPFTFGTGDFTIECWIYPASVNSSTITIVSNRFDAGADTVLFFGFGTSHGLYFHTQNTVVLNSGVNATVNTWQHVALCRASGTVRIFLNGTQVGSSASSAQNLSATVPVFVGQDGTKTTGVSAQYNGYIDDLRITKGIARYTTTFTPPTSPFITF